MVVPRLVRNCLAVLLLWLAMDLGTGIRVQLLGRRMVLASGWLPLVVSRTADHTPPFLGTLESAVDDSEPCLDSRKRERV